MKKLSLCASLLLFATSAMAATPAGLPFIQDKYSQALSEAKQRKLPMFVEVWAPW
jgi:hypothetical protein